MTFAALIAQLEEYLEEAKIKLAESRDISKAPKSDFIFFQGQIWAKEYVEEIENKITKLLEFIKNNNVSLSDDAHVLEYYFLK